MEWLRAKDFAFFFLFKLTSTFYHSNFFPINRFRNLFIDFLLLNREKTVILNFCIHIEILFGSWFKTFEKKIPLRNTIFIGIFNFIITYNFIIIKTIFFCDISISFFIPKNCNVDFHMIFPLLDAIILFLENKTH